MIPIVRISTPLVWDMSLSLWKISSLLLKHEIWQKIRVFAFLFHPYVKKTVDFNWEVPTTTTFLWAWSSDSLKTISIQQNLFSFKIGTEKKVKDLQKSPQHSLGLYAMDYNSDDITHVPSLDKNLTPHFSSRKSFDKKVDKLDN